MIELGTLPCVVVAGSSAYRRAVAAGTWSWTAFGWTLLAMLVWVAAIVGGGVGVARIVGRDRGGPIVAGILVPLVVGAVPVLMIANRFDPGRKREPEPKLRTAGGNASVAAASGEVADNVSQEMERRGRQSRRPLSGGDNRSKQQGGGRS